MKKFVPLIAVLAFMPQMAHALANEWSEPGFMGGYGTFILTNSKKQLIDLSCNYGAGSFGVDHSISYYPKGRNGNSTNPNIISMKFDNGPMMYPPAAKRPTTRTNRGAADWKKFVNGIAKARKIQVYANNKLVATFTPTAKSVKEFSTTVKEVCGEPLRDMD
ncbi:hypothetical protein B0181_06640 [Moraxella caviae]|uniref:Uncharacterized protein n=1 Tax=Moraxella caviae TaxID=34060 RepID=A0A1T0A263_9GAMM|nr:hypothetical protein [Moraxella caviae]OOR89639.1 hypothetical protein B0181_06640 [Moraxella caviae]STZ10327.1 Uncharacterised protein [Moraxella caviae]VEW10443.1 Uncharacterised protein [Moraxella caviae]